LNLWDRPRQSILFELCPVESLKPDDTQLMGVQKPRPDPVYLLVEGTVSVRPTA
jgi:hypothetical protein